MTLTSLASHYRQIASKLGNMPREMLFRLLATDYAWIADLLDDAIREGTVKVLIGELRGKLKRRLTYPHHQKRNATLQVVATTIERTNRDEMVRRVT